MLTIGLAAEAGDGVATLSPTGRILAGAWLAVSLLAHLAWRGAGPSTPARLWGARIAHGGVAVAVAGILLSSMFTSTIQRSLSPGESLRFNAWTVQLHDVWPAAGEGWAGLSAEIRASSGSGVIVLEPQQHLLGNLNATDTARFRDGSGLLTASFGSRNSEGRWPIRLSWTPMLVLIPIGLIIAAMGMIGAMIGPAIRRRRRLRQARLATAWWA